MKVLEFNPQPYPTSLLVVGFPSHGLVGGIATNFLISSHSMSLIGTLNDDRLPPSVTVVDGVAVSPIQLWAGTERCGLDGDCEQLLIVKSDIPPAPELYASIGDAVLSWAKEKGIRLVVALEGVNAAEASEEFVNVVGLVSPTARHLLGRKEFELMGNTIVTGPSAAFLMKSMELDVPVLSLFTRASPDFPDAAATAKLLAALNPLVPLIEIDPEPLRQQAQIIEQTIRKGMKTQQENLSRLAEQQSSMYA